MEVFTTLFTLYAPKRGDIGKLGKIPIKFIKLCKKNKILKKNCVKFSGFVTLINSIEMSTN